MLSKTKLHHRELSMGPGLRRDDDALLRISRLKRLLTRVG
jgi:hypothetical protein